jgi:MFS family permease
MNVHREVPGNLILRWLGARSWITICVVGWGAAQVGMAFVPNWGLLCLTRVLLGIFEVHNTLSPPTHTQNVRFWLTRDLCV